MMWKLLFQEPWAGEAAKMVLLVDKFKPKTFDDLSLHSDVNEELQRLCSSGDELPHMLFYGPRGSGKMTRIRVLLQQLFDSSITKIKIDEKAFQTPSGKKIEVTVFSSNYHIEINPSDVGIYDRVVMQEIIKELAQTQQVDKSKRVFKVAVILEADRLSKEAQHALRRTMEKYSSNLRLILCCNSTGKIITPIKSRCLLMRIPGISDEEADKVLSTSSAAEGFKVSPDNMNKIIRECNGNLRKGLLLLEACAASGSFEALDWQHHIDKISSQIIKEQTPASLLAIRPLIYDLLSHCIPANLIIKETLFNLLKTPRAQVIASELIEAAASYETRLSKGSKAIFHIEAFVAYSMSLLSKA